MLISQSKNTLLHPLNIIISTTGRHRAFPLLRSHPEMPRQSYECIASGTGSSAVTVASLLDSSLAYYIYFEALEELGIAQATDGNDLIDGSLCGIDAEHCSRAS